MARVIPALRVLFGRERTNADVTAELAHHVALEIEERVSRGMTHEEARRTTLRDLGPHDRWVEETRAVRGWTLIDELRQDVRYSLRQIVHQPGFHAVVIGVLAIGIGVNTAVLTVTNAMVSRPAPGVEASDDLMLVMPHLQTARGGIAPRSITYREFLSLRAVGEFAQTAAWARRWVAVGEAGEAAQRVDAQLVSNSFFNVLGVRMHEGSGLPPLDDAITTSFAPNAVISYRYWQTRLGGRANVIGTRITVNGVPFAITGVAPEKFNGAEAFEDWYDIWIPLAAAPTVFSATGDDLLRDVASLDVVARVRPETSAVQAGGAARTALRAAMQAATGTERRTVTAVEILPLRAVSRANGLLLAGASGGALSVIILLIAIANSSNLLLARAVSRRREIGIRMSMGGGRARVLRQLLTESLLIAALAALCGALLVLWAARAFDNLMPMALDTSPHWRTFALTGLLAAVTGVLFGVLPAIYTLRIPIFDILKSGVGSVDVKRSRLQGAFVAAQLALTLPLLTGPAMMLAEARAFATADVGIDTDRVFAASLFLEQAQLSGQQTNALHADLSDRISALPGVSAVSVANIAPFFDHSAPGRFFTRAEHQDGNGWRSDVVAVDEHYFELLDIDVLAGRAFNRTDMGGGAVVVVVSENFARAVWPGEDAIGRQLAHIRPRREVLLDGSTKWHRDRIVSTVVGVVESVRLDVFGDGSQPRQPGTRRSFDTPIVYFPSTQQPDSQTAVVLVRSGASAAATLSGLRAALNSIDKRIAVEAVTTLEARRHDMLWAVRRIVGLLVFVGVLAVLLACIGVYSVISYAVRQRTRDIAVRMAVGARASQVAALFFRRGLLLTAIGIAFGAPLTALARFIVYSTGGGAAGSILGTAAILLGVVLLLTVAAIASWLPARRVAGVDPLVALRVE